MKSLSKDRHESYETTKIFFICIEKFENEYLKDKKNIVNLEIIVFLKGNIEVVLIAYVLKNVVCLKKFL